MTQQMCNVQLLTSTIECLYASIPETLLHVTLKRQAEISADIFARLLQYFRLSCKNSTIKSHTHHGIYSEYIVNIMSI